VPGGKENASTGALEKLERLGEVVARAQRILVLSHTNPDPDSIGASAALAFLIETRWGKEATLAYDGLLGRLENRAMVEHLQLPLRELRGLAHEEYDTVALVDAQPQGTNQPLAGDARVRIVIDHHGAPPHPDAEYADVREHYGASSTILTEYLREAGVSIDARIATALYYGIITDTLDLGRDVSRAEIEATTFLYPLILHVTLSRITHPKVPREHLVYIMNGLRRATAYGELAVCDAGALPYTDAAAQLADTLVFIEGVRWALVLGEHEGTLYFSLRTDMRGGGAGRVALSMAEELGRAGGHGMSAGGQVDLRGVDEARRREMTRTLIDRFITLLEGDVASGAALFGEDWKSIGPPGWAAGVRPR